MSPAAGPSWSTWLRRWAFALGVLGVAVAGGAQLLPRQGEVERSATVQAPPAAVYALLAEPRRWVEWTIWNRRAPSMRIAYGGAPAGAGAAWSWASATEGDGQARIVAADAGRRLAYEWRAAPWAEAAQGELLLEPWGSGTRVRWRVSGSLPADAVSRWSGLALDRAVGKDLDASLMILKSMAERG